MKNEKKFVNNNILLLLCLPYSVEAASVQSTESEGSIQFSGHYEPIGIPDPPPVLITQTGGNLPQTNTVVQNDSLILIGWLIIILVIIIGVKIRLRKPKIKFERGNHI
ncbi:LPXTG cell wall anchor domain-containing protein [Enterococcus sp. DIV0806c]|uniref:LPXTG cell wall anchor domain-containing protein n=1 Tax=unclassified Enterococcus TaxID=2608891 RepID=UPI003F256FC4